MTAYDFLAQYHDAALSAPSADHARTPDPAPEPEAPASLSEDHNPLLAFVRNKMGACLSQPSSPAKPIQNRTNTSLQTYAVLTEVLPGLCI